ncbi:MAG: ACT domain-containing protein [Cyanobacteria bacterium J06626_14]
MSSQSGETDLEILLESLEPELHPAVHVFCTLERDEPIQDEVRPICQFQEAEGTTLIVEQSQAEAFQLDYTYPCRMITLTVHSSLEAVGLLASVTQALAAKDISVNAISAYYHDHLFVECDRVADAMTCLQRLKT